MNKLSNMVSMEIDPTAPPKEEEVTEQEPALPIYPYGLAICLTQEELDKLEVDYADWGVGDLFHLHAMAKITSITENESTEGKRCRVEMQIIALTGEDEEQENEEAEEVPAKRVVRMPYK